MERKGGGWTQGHSVLKKIYTALWILCGLSWLATATNFYFDTCLYSCDTSQCRFADAVHEYLFGISFLLLPLLTIAAIVRWVRHKAISLREGLVALASWGLFLFSASFFGSS